MPLPYKTRREFLSTVALTGTAAIATGLATAPAAATERGWDERPMR